MMKPIFLQFSCREQNKPDFRQARAVTKHEPDIILFETPEKDGSPELIFNKYTCKNKPLRKVKIIQGELRRVSKRFG